MTLASNLRIFTTQVRSMTGPTIIVRTLKGVGSADVVAWAFCNIYPRQRGGASSAARLLAWEGRDSKFGQGPSAGHWTLSLRIRLLLFSWSRGTVPKHLTCQADNQDRGSKSWCKVILSVRSGNDWYKLWQTSKKKDLCAIRAYVVIVRVSLVQNTHYAEEINFLVITK